MKVALFNEFDTEKNNSAGITVRDLFGEDYCQKTLRVSVITSHIKAQKDGTTVFDSRFGYNGIIEIKNILKNESIDAIYSTGNSLKMLAFLAYIRLATKIPIIIHYFDNWRETRHPFITNQLLRLISGKKEKAFVISDMMGAHYREKYHGEYTTLMVGSNSCSVVKNNMHTDDGTIRFLYAGGFHLSRGDALLKFEQCLRERSKCNLRLDIVTFQADYEKYYNRFDSTITTFHVDISHEMISAYYQKADALLFVEPAPDECLMFLKYSMSTKIPEYLVSGLPILCISKPGIAPYEYFRKTGTALLATNKKEVYDAIDILVDDQKRINEMVEKAKLTGHRDFDRDHQRNILMNTIESMVQSEKSE